MMINGRRKISSESAVQTVRQRVLVTWISLVVLFIIITYFYRNKIQEDFEFNSIEHFEEKYCKHIYGNVAIVQLISGSNYINKTINNALQSLSRYAKLRNYTLYQIMMDENNKITSGFENNTSTAKVLEIICHGYTLTAMRHCIVSYMLQNYDYIVHLDADTGVVNPNKCFEHFITPSLHLTFLMGFHSGEIQAGNYIAKNTKFSQDFLRTWLKNTKTPIWNIGSVKISPKSPTNDQEALHKTFSDFYLSTKELCSLTLKEKQTGYFHWIKCIVWALQRKSKKTREKQVKIYNRAHGFIRDGWYTKYLWSERDFLFRAMNYENDDVLFRRVLNGNHCNISNNWDLPIKGKYYVGNQLQMGRIWYSIDERNFDTVQHLALISKISDCWPYCQNIIL